MIKKILITGGSGLCGSILHKGLSKKGYKILSCDINTKLSDAAKSLRIKPDHKITKVDLRNFSQVLKITRGIDAVIHFGGIARHKPEDDDFKKIINHNIIGTYNVFEASRLNKVQRIIFASSAHTIGFHDRKKKLNERALFRPDSHYGVSKCFGESLASLYADKYNIKSLSIRIGSVLPKPSDQRFLSTWISYSDLIQLVKIGLTNKKIHSSVVYGVSKNKRSWWDNKHAYKLGYRPKDNAERFVNSKLTFNESKNTMALKFHGGLFTADNFNGNIKDILRKK